MRITQLDDGVMVTCPAKLNLFLEVLGRRSDGYHEIVTVMQTIGLCDQVSIRRAAKGIKLSCSMPGVPEDEGNTAYRAAGLLLTRGGLSGGLRIHIEKQIPVGAGLGGGSSDAAGVLLGLNAMYGLGLPLQELRGLAAEVGSDVPFFLTPGTALCTGRGEVVQPVPAAGGCHYILVMSGLSVSTAAVYANVENRLTRTGQDVSIIAESLERGDIRALASCLFNRLEEPAFSLYPALREAKQEMIRACASGVLMSGSGSTIFCLCHSEEDAAEKRRRVEALGVGVVGSAATYC